MSTRALLLVLMLAAGSARAGTPRFESPSAVAAAQERYLHGKQLYADKQFREAAAEFAAAYALDADSKFLLFNAALAQRMAGACEEAVASYRAFLGAGPPEELAANARVGIERCAIDTKPIDTRPVDTKPVDTKPVDTKPVDTKPVDTRPTGDRGGARTEQRAAPWYSDGVGDALVGIGAAAMLTGLAFDLVAHSAARDSYHPSSLADYESIRSSANRYQGVGVIAASAGAALVIGGLVRYRLHSTTRTVTIEPRDGGVAAGVGGSF